MNRISLLDGFEALRRRYHGFSVRERCLVALTVAAATWMLWNSTLGSYLDRSAERLDGAVSSAKMRIQRASAESLRLQALLGVDPNAPLIRERERLSARVEQQDGALGATLARFVDPERMPALLEDVMGQYAGLTLKRIETLPVEVLALSGGDVGAQPVMLYRHPMRLQFEGSYFDVTAYLAELERGSWALGWRALDYEVVAYPLARITLEIETLSREQNWIGV